MGKFIDLSGKRFGKLVAVKRIVSETGHGLHAVWECICDCGETTTARSSLLRSENTTSCGCKTSARDLVGKRFGKLEVTSRKGSNGDGEPLWQCLCACGKHHVTQGRLLLNGQSRSCGCNKKYNNFRHGLSYTTEYARARHSKRKAHKLANGGSHTASEIRTTIESQNNKCYYCGKELISWHQDHKTPLSRGGSDDISNIAISCPSCNLRKRDRTEKEFYTFLSDNKTSA